MRPTKQCQAFDFECIFFSFFCCFLLIIRCNLFEWNPSLPLNNFRISFREKKNSSSSQRTNEKYPIKQYYIVSSNGNWKLKLRRNDGIANNAGKKNYSKKNNNKMNKMRKRYLNSWTNNNNYSLFIVQVIAFYMKNALSILDIYLFVILCSFLLSSTSRKLFISWIMDDEKKREIKKRIIFWLLPKHELNNSLCWTNSLLWAWVMGWWAYKNYFNSTFLNMILFGAKAMQQNQIPNDWIHIWKSSQSTTKMFLSIV